MVFLKKIINKIKYILSYLIINNSLIISSDHIIKQEKKIILFDIHYVLVYKKSINYFNALINVKNKLKCIYQLIKAFLNFKVLKKIYYYFKEKNRITESYFRIFKDNGYDDLYSGCISFATDIYKNENKEIIEIFKTLKKNGHEIYLLSNIGPELLENLINQHKYLFEEFKDHNGIIKNLINNNISDKHKLIWKPMPESYQNAIINLNLLNFKKCIFIDDKKINIDTAKSLKCDSILFENIKKLKIELQNRYLI